MKGFHFTLEAVRTLRQRQEQKALEHYATSLLARQQALDKLDAVQRELNAGFTELRAQMAKGCVATEIAQAQEYHRQLGRRRDECTVALGAAEGRVNAATEPMRTAPHQREIIDKF